MKDDNKSSVIKEALTEYKEIREAAEANATQNLAKKFPNEFNNLLKEELNKNKTTKESSYKKIDETKESDKDDVDVNKESVMKKQKETKKVVKKGVAKNQPFDKTAPVEGPDVVKEEREKDFMGDVESGTPNINSPLPEDGDTFTEKITTKQDTLANKTSVKEEFNITELDATAALDNAEDLDEVITMDEIESEIAGMSLEEELSDMAGMPRPTEQPRGKATGQEGDPYEKLVKMREQLDEMISGMGSVEEQKNHGGKGANNVKDGGPTTAMIDEDAEKEEITGDDVEAVLGGVSEQAEEVDENLEHTQTHGNATNVGAENHTNYGKAARLRPAMRNESADKKIGSLISENKNLTKKLNETKKYKKSVSTLVEQYKGALDKYRNQLKEMATFNTNLAHVNNLLVNEGLALTQDDKIKIINEFKKVDTIAESQNKYKAFLIEMKDSKKTLTETIEDKVTTSVASSSKNLEEAKEVTAYADDKHIDRMKKLIEYAEKRDKRTLNS